MLRSLLLRHCLLRCSLRLRRLRRLSAAQRVSGFFFFALFFFLSNTPRSLRCSHRCPRVHACFIHAPRKFTFFVFGQFRTERDLFRGGCRTPVRLFSSSLLCFPLSVRITLHCIRISPCCRRAVLPPCRGRNDRKDGGLVQIDQSDGPRGLGWRFERCRSSAQQRLLREQANRSSGNGIAFLRVL